MENLIDGTQPKRQYRTVGLCQRFNAKDYELIVNWLEMPGHLEVVIGCEGKTKVGGKFPNKKQALLSMAAYVNDNQLVNQKTRLETISWDGARYRFMTLQDKYRATRDAKTSTGWGLTDVDAKKKVFTLEAKVQSMCLCFDRLDAMFGESPNLQTKENIYVSGTNTHPEQMPQPPPPQDCFVDLLEADDVDVADSTPETPITNIEPASPATEGLSTPLEVEDGPAHTLDADSSAPHSTGSTRGIPKVISENVRKLKVPAAKKANTGKGIGFASSFVTSLESIFDRKAKSMDLKERLSERWFKLQDDKLKLEEAKMHESLCLAKAQVLQNVIKENFHRSPVELQELLKIVSEGLS